jgi:hypothetical protein
MHPDTTIQLATIHQDELRRAATHHRRTATTRRLPTRWARRTIPERGSRS